MTETEKVSMNLSAVDLGRVDVLVEEGFYSNRSDFLRTAIRNQLNRHSADMDQIKTRKSFAIGVVGYGEKALLRKMEEGTMVDINVIGVLVIEDDVTPELALDTINSLRVRGSFNAPADVQAALAEAGRIL